MERPKRYIEVELKIGADSLGDLIAVLDDIRNEFILQGTANGVSGGPSAGYVVRTDIDPEQTRESYAKQLEAWLRDRKEETTNDRPTDE